MKGLLQVTAMSFRMWWRDKSAVWWGIVFPILFMGLIGLVFGGGDNLRFSVSVVADPADPLAQGALEAFRSVPVFDVVVEDETEALAGLREGNRSMVVVVPTVAAVSAGTGPAVVDVYYDDANAQVNQAAVAIVAQVVGEINKQMTGGRDVITLQAQGIASEEMSMFDFLLPGVIAMTVMQTGLMGVTWVVANYRERQVLKRVLATPFSPLAFLAGLVARFTVVNVLQAVVIFLVATFAFGAKTLGSLLHLGVLTILGSVTFLAIGFAVSTLSRTAEAANTLGSVLNFPMLFLSGTFWPKEMLPDAIRPVVGLLPLTPLVDALRGVGAMGDPIGAYTPGILYLFAWAAAGFLVAAWRFRWE